MAEGRFRRALRRLTADDEELVAEDLQEGAEKYGCSLISDAPGRAKVRLHGSLQAVTLRPQGGVPALEAELYDGTGTVYVIWLGRRRIEGIRAGVSIVVEGRLTESTPGRRTIYNPSYELIPQRAD
ncbi:MAG TPA: OB-fold nucleic acid binding domain-containing protein [Frankiaceae bacterium]|nr:OB-fold nucleic acid binding domain-containing protein [Frankiaceae bacterium]